MKKQPKELLHASDVLNWDYLVEIGEKPEGPPRDFAYEIKGFAYDFTSTGDESVRDELLIGILLRGTHGQSRQTAEEIIKTLGGYLHSDRKVLRRFAKQNGVRLINDWLLARLDPTFSYP